LRYIQVTHTYVLPIEDEEELEDPSMDSIINSGVSMMEAHMRGLFEDNREIQSSWQTMPREYQEGETRHRGKVPEKMPEDSVDQAEAKYMIENDLDQGVSFTRDIFGQQPKAMHPWDQGLSIFPVDHPLRGIEDHFRAQRDMEGLDLLKKQLPGPHKQLESGDE
jgi:hypothetical protein